MNELKPCPFCGGEAELTGFDAPEVWVWCPNCKASTDAHTCKGGAIEAWNTRAERTCRIAEYNEAPFLACSECGAVQPDDFMVYYCWSCGAKVVDE